MYSAKLIGVTKEHSIDDNYDYLAVRFHILNEDEEVLFDLNHGFDLLTTADEIRDAIALAASREYEKAQTAIENADYEERQAAANKTIEELLKTSDEEVKE